MSSQKLFKLFCWFFVGPLQELYWSLINPWWLCLWTWEIMACCAWHFFCCQDWKKNLLHNNQQYHLRQYPKCASKCKSKLFQEHLSHPSFCHSYVIIYETIQVYFLWEQALTLKHNLFKIKISLKKLIKKSSFINQLSSKFSYNLLWKYSMLFY